MGHFSLKDFQPFICLWGTQAGVKPGHIDLFTCPWKLWGLNRSWIVTAETVTQTTENVCSLAFNRKRLSVPESYLTNESIKIEAPLVNILVLLIKSLFADIIKQRKMQFISPLFFYNLIFIPSNKNLVFTTSFHILEWSNFRTKSFFLYKPIGKSHPAFININVFILLCNDYT